MTGSPFLRLPVSAWRWIGAVTLRTRTCDLHHRNFSLGDKNLDRPSGRLSSASRLLRRFHRPRSAVGTDWLLSPLPLSLRGQECPRHTKRIGRASPRQQALFCLVPKLSAAEVPTSGSSECPTLDEVITTGRTLLPGRPSLGPGFARPSCPWQRRHPVPRR